MGTLLVVILLIVLCWPMIKRWLARFMARRAEDWLRNAAGLPPRPDSRAGRRAARERERRNTRNGRAGGRAQQAATSGGPIIPKEYAVDVEFTEIKEFGETEIGNGNQSASKVRTESQVSDAEWVEIKEKKQ